MAFEISIVEKFIFDTLVADATIAGLIERRVYQMRAPRAAVRPFVIISYVTGSDVNTFGARGLAQPLFDVKVSGTHEVIAALRAVAGRVDALLQDAKAVTASGWHIRIQREAPIRQPEDSDGVEYHNLGGQYRCWISPAS